MTVTFPLEVELAEAMLELGRARHAKLMHECADIESRVTDRGLWRHTLRKARENVERLEAVVAELQRRLEEE